MAQRSRTGCLTCRQRKLKCTEEKPVCAQCARGNRECTAGQRITFRHQQNPSMNGDVKLRDNLKSFYGYKETFRNETTWLPVPQELTWTHTNNPFLDADAVDRQGGLAETGFGRSSGRDLRGIQGQGRDEIFGHGIQNVMWQGPNEVTEHQTHIDDLVAQLSQATGPAAAYPSCTTYPAYATHGLEALSAVASQDTYNYAPPPAPMAAEESVPMQNLEAPSLTDHVTTVQVEHGSDPPPARSPTTQTTQSNIDPQLHAASAMERP